MNINVFILCFNESIILPHTIAHYKKYLPSCKITISDNESTDNSVEIAQSLGCDIISFNSGNIQNEYVQRDIRNHYWKKIENGWIIFIDMDEWLCVTEEDLFNELNAGTTILKVKGVNVIGESKEINLSDINLHNVNRVVDWDPESKKLCFLREKITEMNYTFGGHECDPKGEVIYSNKVYINKHYSELGLPFLIEKMRIRYQRTHEMRSRGMDGHYTDNIEKITEHYNKLLSDSYLLHSH